MVPTAVDVDELEEDEEADQKPQARPETNMRDDTIRENDFQEEVAEEGIKREQDKKEKQGQGEDGDNFKYNNS